MVLPVTAGVREGIRFRRCHLDPVTGVGRESYDVALCKIHLTWIVNLVGKAATQLLFPVPLPCSTLPDKDAEVNIIISRLHEKNCSSLCEPKSFENCLRWP